MGEARPAWGRVAIGWYGGSSNGGWGLRVTTLISLNNLKHLILCPYYVPYSNIQTFALFALANRLQTSELLVTCSLVRYNEINGLAFIESDIRISAQHVVYAMPGIGLEILIIRVKMG